MCNVSEAHSPDKERNKGEVAGDEPNGCKKEEDCTDNNGDFSNGLVSRNCDTYFSAFYRIDCFRKMKVQIT